MNRIRVLIPSIVVASSITTMAHAAPDPASAPISTSAKVRDEALSLASLLGLSVVRTEVLVRARIHQYDVYTYDRYLTPGSADASLFVGTLLMPDVGRNIVSVKHGDRFLGYLYRHGSSLSQLLANHDGAVYGVASIGDDGSVGASLDLDGDGVSDFSDFIRNDGTHVTFIQRGLGREFAEAWIMGRNPLCLTASAAVSARDLTASADPRALLNACPARDTSASTSSSGSGPFASAPSRHPLDPLAQMCAPYDARMRPEAFTGGTYAGDGVTTEDVIVGTAAALAYRSFIRALATPINFYDCPVCAATAAETTATRLAQYNAIGIFIAITLTPSSTTAASCETGPAGACAEEAARARAEIAEEEAEDTAPVPVPDSSPDPDPTPPSTPETAGGTEERPESISEGAAMARFCAATAGGRTEWQKALDDAQKNGFAPKCEDPAADSSKYADNLYCATMRRLFDLQPYDPAKELANPAKCDYDKAICFDDPTDRIRGKFAELFRMATGLAGFVCNPLVCDPELFKSLK